RIVRKRFGIDEKRNYTMEELGRQFGVSKERIRQIQKKAMIKLGHPKRKRALEGLYE
ncbi:MAG: RNA polymerase sigma factor RpoD, partial [Proteobacteria bacterium]|nr:RNA polymerase sigma factor RpoD [Pseudomonadota bacterium]